MAWMDLDDRTVAPKLRAVDPDEPLVTEHLQEQLWKQRIDKMVKTAKDIASSSWAVPLLLTLLLGYWVYSDQKSSGKLSSIEVRLEKEHELLVRLDQQKMDKEKENEKEQERRDRIDRENDVWRQNMLVKMAVLEKGK